jgi:hypothetical protein
MDCFLLVLFILVLFAIFICLENSGYFKNNKQMIIEGIDGVTPATGTGPSWDGMCVPPEKPDGVEDQEWESLEGRCNRYIISTENPTEEACQSAAAPEGGTPEEIAIGNQYPCIYIPGSTGNLEEDEENLESILRIAGAGECRDAEGNPLPGRWTEARCTGLTGNNFSWKNPTDKLEILNNIPAEHRPTDEQFQNELNVKIGDVICVGSLQDGQCEKSADDGAPDHNGVIRNYRNFGDVNFLSGTGGTGMTWSPPTDSTINVLKHPDDGATFGYCLDEELREITTITESENCTDPNQWVSKETLAIIPSNYDYTNCPINPLADDITRATDNPTCYSLEEETFYYPHCEIPVGNGSSIPKPTRYYMTDVAGDYSKTLRQICEGVQTERVWVPNQSSSRLNSETLAILTQAAASAESSDVESAIAEFGVIPDTLDISQSITLSDDAIAASELANNQSCAFDTGIFGGMYQYNGTDSNLLTSENITNLSTPVQVRMDGTIQDTTDITFNSFQHGGIKDDIICNPDWATGVVSHTNCAESIQDIPDINALTSDQLSAHIINIAGCTLNQCTVPDTVFERYNIGGVPEAGEINESDTCGVITDENLCNDNELCSFVDGSCLGSCATISSSNECNPPCNWENDRCFRLDSNPTVTINEIVVDPETGFIPSVTCKSDYHMVTNTDGELEGIICNGGNLSIPSVDQGCIINSCNFPQNTNYLCNGGTCSGSYQVDQVPTLTCSSDDIINYFQIDNSGGPITGLMQTSFSNSSQPEITCPAHDGQYQIDNNICHEPVCKNLYKEGDPESVIIVGEGGTNLGEIHQQCTTEQEESGEPCFFDSIVHTSNDTENFYSQTTLPSIDTYLSCGPNYSTSGNITADPQCYNQYDITRRNENLTDAGVPVPEVVSQAVNAAGGNVEEGIGNVPLSDLILMTPLPFKINDFCVANNCSWPVDEETKKYKDATGADIDGSASQTANDWNREGDGQNLLCNSGVENADAPWTDYDHCTYRASIDTCSSGQGCIWNATDNTCVNGTENNVISTKICGGEEGVTITKQDIMDMMTGVDQSLMVTSEEYDNFISSGRGGQFKIHECYSKSNTNDPLVRCSDDGSPGTILNQCIPNQCTVDYSSSQGALSLNEGIEFLIKRDDNSVLKINKNENAEESFSVNQILHIECAEGYVKMTEANNTIGNIEVQCSENANTLDIKGACRPIECVNNPSNDPELLNNFNGPVAEAERSAWLEGDPHSLTQDFITWTSDNSLINQYQNGVTNEVVNRTAGVNDFLRYSIDGNGGVTCRVQDDISNESIASSTCEFVATLVGNQISQDTNEFTYGFTIGGCQPELCEYNGSTGNINSLGLEPFGTTHSLENGHKYTMEYLLSDEGPNYDFKCPEKYENTSGITLGCNNAVLDIDGDKGGCELIQVIIPNGLAPEDSIARKVYDSYEDQEIKNKWDKVRDLYNLTDVMLSGAPFDITLLSNITCNQSISDPPLDEIEISALNNRDSTDREANTTSAIKYTIMDGTETIEYSLPINLITGGFNESPDITNTARCIEAICAQPGQFGYDETNIFYTQRTQDGAISPLPTKDIGYNIPSTLNQNSLNEITCKTENGYNGSAVATCNDSILDISGCTENYCGITDNILYTYGTGINSIMSDQMDDTNTTSFISQEQFNSNDVTCNQMIAHQIGGTPSALCTTNDSPLELTGCGIKPLIDSRNHETGQVGYTWEFHNCFGQWENSIKYLSGTNVADLPDTSDPRYTNEATPIDASTPEGHGLLNDFMKISKSLCGRNPQCIGFTVEKLDPRSSGRDPGSSGFIYMSTQQNNASCSVANAQRAQTEYGGSHFCLENYSDYGEGSETEPYEGSARGNNSCLYKTVNGEDIIRDEHIPLPSSKPGGVFFRMKTPAAGETDFEAADIAPDAPQP